MLRSVLIAGRGEIAMRILRSAADLGLTTIAVHTDEDADAAHVTAADAAIRIDSYLEGEQIVAAAIATGAEAIHPGYGFLSERADFARSCARAGLVFIGPEAAAIETMGDKISARAAVAARGVATVPGLAEPGLDDAALIAGAADVGFPLLVKPAAGGGGKGMHRVAEPSELPAALATARREAAGAFGDDTLFLERWITSPRHIEVQILADAHGQVVHLGERECSLQRRHQKVIEEAPSPSLTPAQRARFGQAAVAAARAVAYRGAGTVEFIVDAAAPEQPFFLEMNTRLQVEHAVTEAVTGYDLVAEQIRIADGQPLSIRQGEVRASGHAIEARVYAEDPDAGFLPTGGTVLDLALPEGVRVDHALAVGTTVSSSYDPMLAKVIAHAPAREEALKSLDRALAATHVLGVVTNTAFLRALLGQEEVVAGVVDTGLIERRLDHLARPPITARTLAVAALVRWDHVARGRCDDLWHAPTGWRLGERAPFVVRFDGAGGAEEADAPGAVLRTVELTGSPAVARARVDGEEISLALHPGAVTIDGHRLPLIRHGTDRAVWIGLPGEDRELTLHFPLRSAGVRDAAPTLESPMPGTVTAVLVAEGDEVAAGDPVLVVEAMKMEHTLHAPSPGTVRLRVAIGDRVGRGQELAQVITDRTALEAAPDEHVPDEHAPGETVPGEPRRPAHDH
ncbi:MAG: acetyl/propionyl-CoA carboxylase subunit alpha [Brachybacterium sp.]|uniref:acetyl/propionyl/methylcrotonyl-CoA carboxylase subunit alpha n=1 Tax=Brachybacterium sp. TaxID=1891286 RepID=UPI002647F09B|nr:biotin carboxylase N-terminal domain-containing protein [Brachybacterium sp.]MDN5687306.1 acetyl/propionyl-CoA carboxylase subunit alpha [Brachybacterium sp.]